MKRNILGALCFVSMLLCGCGQKVNTEEEKVYTEEELGVIVEWASSGWSEVYNDTKELVTLTTSYYPGAQPRPLTSVIKPGEAVKLNAGAYVPGVSIDECIKAIIKFSDNTQILCDRESDYAWSKRFFENVQQRKEVEVVELAGGKKVSHDLVVRTFHIDNTLKELWEEWLEKNMSDGLWAPIELDKPEVTFPAEGGTEIITALNYEAWWIEYGYEDVQNVNGELVYSNFVCASSSAGAECPDILEGGWYHVSIPNRGQSNQLLITVDAKYEAKPRQATIEMESGDVFTQVKIYQP